MILLHTVCSQDAINSERYAHEARTAREKASARRAELEDRGSKEEEVVKDGDFVAALDTAIACEAQRGHILEQTKPNCLGDCLRALCFCCRRGDATVHPHSDLGRNPLMKLRFLQYDRHLLARERLEIARTEHSMMAETSAVPGKRIVAPPPPPPKAAFGPEDVGKTLRISGDAVEVGGAPRSRRDRAEMTPR